MTTDAAQQLKARQRAEELLEQGWAGTVLVEPLTALAGGLIGGALVALAALAGVRNLARRQ